MKNFNIKKTSNSQAKQTLRKKLLTIRKNFPKAQQKINADYVLAQLINYPDIRSCKNIAVYCSVNGEADTASILTMLQKTEKKCYLPVISSKKAGTFFFAPWDEKREMCVNCYGISEPVCTADEYIGIWNLDVIIVPLVAFDPKGNRLGMGGGFYDRSFFGKNEWHRVPLLIGIAHEFQYIAGGIPTDSWDIKLDAVFTEKNMYGFS